MENPIIHAVGNPVVTTLGIPLAIMSSIDDSSNYLLLLYSYTLGYEPINKNWYEVKFSLGTHDL